METSKGFLLVLICFTLISIFGTTSGDHSKALAQETDPKIFKILKEESTDPKTGLPKTLDPDLFEGNAKQAYRVARLIPEVLIQMLCFCGCEIFGHENLLDCYVDDHAAQG